MAGEHAQWWRSDKKEKIDSRTRKGPGAPLATYSGGPALSARVAEEPNRVLVKELTSAGERAHAALARKAQERELEPWGQFKVSSPVKLGAQSKVLVDTR